MKPDLINRANLEKYAAKPLKIIRPLLEKIDRPISYAIGGGALIVAAAGLNPAILFGIGLGYLVGYTKQQGDRNHLPPQRQIN